MSDHSGSTKQLCPTCGKSYVNLRHHAKSATHQRRIAQVPLFGADQQLAAERAGRHARDAR